VTVLTRNPCRRNHVLVYRRIEEPVSQPDPPACDKSKAAFHTCVKTSCSTCGYVSKFNWAPGANSTKETHRQQRMQRHSVHICTCVSMQRCTCIQKISVDFTSWSRWSPVAQGKTSVSWKSKSKLGALWVEREQWIHIHRMFKPNMKLMYPDGSDASTLEDVLPPSSGWHKCVKWRCWFLSTFKC
jgi:hypothetical protein